MFDQIRSIGLAVLLGCCAAAGCNRLENPGTWSHDEVESYIAEQLELVELSLEKDATGGYSGSGSRANGETVTFTVIQDPESHQISWQAKGDRGSVEDGEYQLK